MLAQVTICGVEKVRNWRLGFGGMANWQSAVALLEDYSRGGITIQHEKTDRNCKSARKTPKLGKWGTFRRYDLNTVKNDIRTTEQE